jgi:hypothetical protein
MNAGKYGDVLQVSSRSTLSSFKSPVHGSVAVHGVQDSWDVAPGVVANPTAAANPGFIHSAN